MNTDTQSRNRFRNSFVILMVLSISVIFLSTIHGFLAALFLAAVFSAMSYPAYEWLLARMRGHDILASITTLLLFLGAIVVPLIFFFGIVVGQAAEMSDVITPWLQQQLHESAERDHRLPDWIPYSQSLEPYRAEITAKVAGLASKVGTFLVGSLSRITQLTAVFLINLFIMLYAMFFFLLNGPAIVRTIMGYMPLSGEEKANLLEVGLSVSKATIKGTLVIGIVQGALGGIGLAVAGVPGAAIWGTVMVVLSIIPGIGSALVWVPAVAYLLMRGDTAAAIGLTVWSAAIVGTVDNFLRPRLVGRDSRMPDLLILLSTLGGLSVFGALGLVLGPVIAALFLTAWTIYGQVFEDVLSEANGRPPRGGGRER